MTISNPLPGLRIGFVGSGNLARAMALGWGEPIFCTDGGSGRAKTLAAEVGGEALASNSQLVERCDLIVLAHKPATLGPIADDLRTAAQSPDSRLRAVVSVLGGVTQSQLRSAYGPIPAYRIEPNTAVRLRRGVLVMENPGAAEDIELNEIAEDVELTQDIVEKFSALGLVIRLPESQFAAASSISGVGPAYWALIVEAQVDAAVRHGLAADTAARLATATMIGSAELLQADHYDTLATRRAVTSPGGITARGLAALERAGLRSAFDDAMEATVGPE